MQSIITSPTGETFTETSSSCNFQHSAACCFWGHLSAVCLLLLTLFFHPSISLSPPFLMSSPPVLSPGAAGEDFSAQIEADSETWQLSRCTSTRPLFSSCCLRFMAAGSHILTSKSAWLGIYIRTHSEHTQHTRKNGKHAETGAETHTHGCTGKHSRRQTCIHRHKHTHKYLCYTHTHTPLSAVLSGQTLAGVGGLD